MANTYCTVADIEDILSTDAVELRIDDLPPTVYGAAIAKAGNQIDKYCYARYSPDGLATSDLVKDWAAIIAAFYLCIRRGNPPLPGIAILYDGAIADLKDIQKGITTIPGVSSRKGYAPVMSRMRSTLRPHPRAVVETSQGASTAGAPTGYTQHNRDPWDAFGFNADIFLAFSF